MKLLNYALGLLFTLSILSCGGGGGSDPDEMAPTVTFTDLDKTSPFTKYTAGQSVVFKASLSDDDVLKSITFTDLSEHSEHTKTVPQFITDFNSKLSTAKPKEDSVAGKAVAPVDFSVEILAGAPAGVYTLTCKVTDDSDNQEDVKLYFEIE